MVMGALWCPKDQRASIGRKLRIIKEKHGIPHNFEIKWTKVSPAKEAFYLELVDTFFSDDRLQFRAVVIPKQKLNHADFEQSHDDFYYKMYFQLLNVIFESKNKYRIYLDIKDTRSETKVRRLHDYLSHAQYDFGKEMIERVQQVESREVAQLQLADLFIGAIGYLNRGLAYNQAKVAIIRRIQEHTGFCLKRSTILGERKFNLFFWHPRESR
jgi:hypothetical protein